MNQPEEARHRKVIFAGIIAMLVIVAVAVGWFLIIKPLVGEEERPQAEIPEEEEAPEAVEEKLEITELKLCDNIDENWVCDENVNKEFSTGDDVWLLVIIKNMGVYKTNNQYYVDLSEYVEVTDEKLNQITSLTGELIHYNRLFAEMPEQIKLKNKFSTKDLTKGNYSISLSIIDNINHKLDTKEVSFKLK